MDRRLHWFSKSLVSWAILGAVTSPALGLAQTPTDDWTAEITKAQNEIIQTETVRIEKLDLGEAGRGKNRFAAIVKNRTKRLVTLGLDLRADPGLWLRKWQVQFLFLLMPGQEKQIQAEYEFLRMSPEAWLRVRFVFPEVMEAGVTSLRKPFFDRKYFVGKGNRAVDYDLSNFQKCESDHIVVYYFPDSLAAKDIDTIADQRETALRLIEEMLGVRHQGRIRLFLFPDAETKRKETGHTGAGWAFENNIVEVYSQETKLDPYHELAHILAARLGNPPAVLEEGFAVYVSERLGGDSLKHLGSPGKKIDEAVATHRANRKVIPLGQLLGFTEIGSEKSQPAVAYPQAASLVKVLIERFGIARFREAYRSLASGNDPEIVLRNTHTFQRIYGKQPSELELEWLAGLPKM